MRFNAIAGLPRTGSTLLCNVLNQNPEFFASSTSPLAAMVGSVSSTLSNAQETQAGLIESDKYVERIVSSVRGLVSGWYASEGAEASTIFDKGRAWAHLAMPLFQVFPDSKLLVTVRDLREIAGSIEKQHRRCPVLDTHPDARASWTRFDQMCGAQGVIGGAMAGIEDLLHRNPDNVIFVDYRTFVSDPELTMRRLYKELDLPIFEHDYDNVENTSSDLDGLYLNKFEHNGSGKIEGTDPDEYKKYLSPELARAIFDRYPLYNARFKYTL